MKSKISIGILLSIPIISIILSVLHSFEIIEPRLCLTYNLTGYECPGCGLTRASLCMIRLNFAEAMNYNRLVVIAFPTVVLAWLLLLWNEIKK